MEPHIEAGDLTVDKLKKHLIVVSKFGTNNQQLNKETSIMALNNGEEGEYDQTFHPLDYDSDDNRERPGNRWRRNEDAVDSWLDSAGQREKRFQSGEFSDEEVGLID